jgi:hypothetical protein
MQLSATFSFLSGSDKPVILRRMTAVGMRLDVQCMARVTVATPEMRYEIERAGGVAQIDRLCIISNTEIEAKQWPGPPRRGDLLYIIDERYSAMILGCASRDLLGMDVRHDLTLRGSG